jgi:hypothetical protein
MYGRPRVGKEFFTSQTWLVQPCVWSVCLAWYHDFARVQGDKLLAFVGCASLKSDIAATAATMRSALGLDLEERQKISACDKTLRRLIDHADALGILVMVNGVVGNTAIGTSIRKSFAALRSPMRAPLWCSRTAKAQLSIGYEPNRATSSAISRLP